MQIKLTRMVIDYPEINKNHGVGETLLLKISKKKKEKTQIFVFLFLRGVVEKKETKRKKYIEL